MRIRRNAHYRIPRVHARAKSDNLPRKPLSKADVPGYAGDALQKQGDIPSFRAPFPEKAFFVMCPAKRGKEIL